MTQSEGDLAQPKGARGRPFAKGNAGRRPGSKNRLSAISASLLAGEEQDLVRRAIELAKAGDTQMLKFLLNRILPRERAVKVYLPKMEYADDAVGLLRDALKAGFNDKDRFKRDSDLNVLRGREDFRQLQAQLYPEPKEKKP